MKKINGATSDIKQVGGKKPHKIHIEARGDIDGQCEGKNVWDEIVKTLISQIFDKCMIEWLNVNKNYTPYKSIQYVFK